MKYFFLSVLALVSLASCSNDDKTIPEGRNKHVMLSFTYGDAVTRNIDVNQVAGAPTLSNVYVEFYPEAACTGTRLSIVTLEAADIANLGTATPVIITAPAAAQGIRIVANNGATVEVSTAIASYQAKNVKTGVAYEGKAAVTGDDTNGWAASVTLNVSVARVEVYGNIGCTNADNGCTVEVTGVYANNYLTTLGASDVYTAATGDDGTINNAVAGMFDKSDETGWADAFGTNSISKCAGYQLFAGSYGVTLAVTVTPETGAPYNGFIVVKSFKKSENDSEIQTLEAGYIYKLDLATSGIKDLFVKNSPETPVTPDPSGQEKAVSVTANVQAWIVQNVLPNL